MNKIAQTLFALSALAIAGAAQAQTFSSTETSYVRGSASYASNNVQSENRLLIGYLDNASFKNVRGVVQFDLGSLIGQTIQSVSFSLTAVAGTSTDQGSAPYANILLKDLGESFTDSTVTWNSLDPNGGDTSGSTLASITGYDVYSGSDLVGGDSIAFTALPSFLTAAQNAIDTNGGILSLLIYAPDAEDGAANNFYRFEQSATLNITTAIPEPASLGLLFGLGALAFISLKRKRS